MMKSKSILVTLVNGKVLKKEVWFGKGYKYAIIILEVKKGGHYSIHMTKEDVIKASRETKVAHMIVDINGKQLEIE